jgi:general secretion pathway protein K
MVVLAIVVAVAADMLRAHQKDVRRAEMLLHGNETIIHLLALETWAREVLIEDLSDGPNDDLSELWAQTLLPVDADGGVLAGRVVDQQGMFNLNNLVDGSGQADQAAMERFRLLLETIGGFQNPLAIVEAATDWIDTDNSVTGLGGAEDNDYALSEPFAYRTPGREMTTPSEMLLVQGLTFDDWNRMRPYVTALPKSQGAATPINVNTAPAMVLQALAGIDAAEAQSIVEDRIDDPFDSVDAFKARIESNLGVDSGANPDLAIFATASEYFLVESEARFGDVLLSMRHLLLRRGGETKVLSRALGNEW